MGYGTTLTPLLLILGFEPLQIVPAVLLSDSRGANWWGWAHWPPSTRGSAAAATALW